MRVLVCPECGGRSMSLDGAEWGTGVVDVRRRTASVPASERLVAHYLLLTCMGCGKAIEVPCRSYGGEVDMDTLEGGITAYGADISAFTTISVEEALEEEEETEEAGDGADG